MPEDPEFEPESEGWVYVREPGPVKLLLITIPLVVLVGLLFKLAFWLAGVDVSPLSNIKNAPIAFVIMLGVVPIHELLHLVCLPGFGLGEKSIVGFWSKMFVPYVYYDGILPRNRFMLICACPAIVLSAIPVLVSFIKPNIPVIIVAVSYLNCLVCGIDLVSIFLVLKQIPSDAVVRLNGFRGYWRRQDSPDIC
jgi:hypothetical protein